jgi:hypothetical protein
MVNLNRLYKVATTVRSKLTVLDTHFCLSSGMVAVWYQHGPTMVPWKQGDRVSFCPITRHSAPPLILLSILHFSINPSTAHLYVTTGVRPSPGAAGPDLPITVESSTMPLVPDVAAPGDGRTPGQPGLDAGGARKMRPFLQDGAAVSVTV